MDDGPQPVARGLPQQEVDRREQSAGQGQQVAQAVALPGAIGSGCQIGPLDEHNAAESQQGSGNPVGGHLYVQQN